MAEFSPRPKVADVVTLCGTVAMMGAPAAFPDIGHTTGLFLFWGGLAGVVLYPIWRWGLHYLRAVPWRLVRVEHSSRSVVNHVPIWHAVEHVRQAINDTNSKECYPATLAALRQAAADGKIKLRGRRELDKNGPQAFSDLHSNIPAEYWGVSTIGPMATAREHASDGFPHTNPETVYAWGPKGIYEKKRYADLMVDMTEVRRLWH